MNIRACPQSDSSLQDAEIHCGLDVHVTTDGESLSGRIVAVHRSNHQLTRITVREKDGEETVVELVQYHYVIVKLSSWLRKHPWGEDRA